MGRRRPRREREEREDACPRFFDDARAHIRLDPTHTDPDSRRHHQSSSTTRTHTILFFRFWRTVRKKEPLGDSTRSERERAEGERRCAASAASGLKLRSFLPAPSSQTQRLSAPPLSAYCSTAPLFPFLLVLLATRTRKSSVPAHTAPILLEGPLSRYCPVSSSRARPPQKRWRGSRASTCAGRRCHRCALLSARESGSRRAPFARARAERGIRLYLPRTHTACEQVGPLPLIIRAVAHNNPPTQPKPTGRLPAHSRRRRRPRVGQTPARRRRTCRARRH